MTSQNIDGDLGEVSKDFKENTPFPKAQGRKEGRKKAKTTVKEHSGNLRDPPCFSANASLVVRVAGTVGGLLT